MKHKRHTQEQIIGILKQQEAGARVVAVHEASPFLAK